MDWGIRCTDFCGCPLIQSSQELHVLLNLVGSAPVMSQGLFSWGIKVCLCLTRILYIVLATSALVPDKLFCSQGSLWILNKHGVLVIEGLQLVSLRSISLLQLIVATWRSLLMSCCVTGLLVDAIDFHARLLVTDDVLYLGLEALLPLSP
jgi:hypothetical protein